MRVARNYRTERTKLGEKLLTVSPGQPEAADVCDTQARDYARNRCRVLFRKFAFHQGRGAPRSVGGGNAYLVKMVAKLQIFPHLPGASAAAMHRRKAVHDVGAGARSCCEPR